MLNQYPLWKNLMIFFVVVLGAIYALPNVYGTDPAVQVSPTKQIEITDAVKDQITGLVESGGLSPKAVDKTEQGLLLRFDNVEDQLKASQILREKLGDEYTAAVNLAPASPAWLDSINALPMYLGLDLRGGLHFLLEVNTDKPIEVAYQSYADDARKAMQKEKVRYLSVSTKDGKLQIRFKDEAVRDKAYDILRPKLGDMQLDTLEDGRSYQIVGSITGPKLLEIKKLAIQQNIATLRNRANELGVAEPVIQQQGESRIVVQLPGIQDSAQAKEILGATASLEFRLQDIDNSVADALEGRVPFGSKLYTKVRDYPNPVLLKRQVITTGAHITHATSGFDSQSGTPAVFINLDGPGGSAMARTTKKNLKKPMAVVFIRDVPKLVTKDGKQQIIWEQDEEVINIATIQGVFSKRFQITGLDNPAEAHTLALLLRAGALAAPIRFVEERTIGPSLGADNIDKGTRSVIVGMIMVLAFMAFWYRGFGMVANLALVMNLVLIMAVLSLLQATLTLPGIAGIVLTVGMAVDANVLIFERIREELRIGNTPQSSINAGYGKALETIADANITTLIAAVVLFIFGTGPIKGFAVTLSVGIVTSMFTAIMGTRAVVNLFVGGRRIKALSIGKLSLFGKQGPHIAFMNKRRIAMVLSTILILTSIGSLATRQLNFGLDFTGGTLIEVGYSDSVELAGIREALNEAGYGDAIVQHFGTSKDVLVRVAPRDDLSSEKISDAVLAVLQDVSDDKAEMRRQEYVGPQIGEELRDDGGLAMLIALAFILLYVIVRFEYRFALGAVAALIHDVIITLGVFSIFQLNFDLTVLAAVLAVIGYSLNDTIVVFDRIRENFRKIRKRSATEVIDTSLNQTLSRTLMTSFTTLLVLLAMFFLGGELIHSFAIALIVGVLVGTYSSIYVASSSALALGVSRANLMPVQQEGAEQESVV